MKPIETLILAACCAFLGFYLGSSNGYEKGQIFARQEAHQQRDDDAKTCRAMILTESERENRFEKIASESSKLMRELRSFKNAFGIKDKEPASLCETFETVCEDLIADRIYEGARENCGHNIQEQPQARWE